MARDAEVAKVGRAPSARDAEVAKVGRAPSARDAEVAKVGRAPSARDAEVAKVGRAPSARDAEVAKVGRAPSARDAEVAKVGRAPSARDAEVAKVGRESGELMEQARDGGPCPHGEENKRLKEDLAQALLVVSVVARAEENKRLKEDLAQARKINSAVTAKIIKAKHNMRTRKGGGARKIREEPDRKIREEPDRKIREEPDRIVMVDPRTRPDRGGGLEGIDGTCSHAVKNTKIETEIVKYEKAVGRCPACDKVQTPPTPVALSGSKHGQNAEIAAASPKTCGISYRNIEDMFRTVMGIDVAEGTIVEMVGRAAGALEPPYAVMVGMPREAKAINGDETSWRINGVNSRLWALVAERHGVFAAEYSRGVSVLLSLPGGFEGTMTIDSHPPHGHVWTTHQKCHVRCPREVKETFEFKDPGPPFQRFARTLRKIPHSSHEMATCEDPEEGSEARGGQAPSPAGRADLQGLRRTQLQAVRQEADAREGPRVHIHNGRHPVRQQQGGTSRAAQRDPVHIAGTLDLSGMDGGTSRAAQRDPVRPRCRFWAQARAAAANTVDKPTTRQSPAGAPGGCRLRAAAASGGAAREPDRLLHRAAGASADTKNRPKIVICYHERRQGRARSDANLRRTDFGFRH